MKTLLLLLLTAATGNDAYQTHRLITYSYVNPATGLHYYGVEHNPIARPFVHNTVGVVGYFGGSFALRLYGAHALRRRHHNKLADIVMLEGIADHGAAGVWTAQNLK